MKKYVGKKIIQMLVVMLLISFLSFGIIYIAPGDVSSMYITPDMTQEQQDAIIANLGLDKGFLEQYTGWLTRALQGDLGNSMANRAPVADQFARRLPATLLLMGTSTILAIVVAIPLGLLAGLYENRLTDNTISGISYVGMAIPSFWLGMLLIIVFTGKLGLLPSSGMSTPGQASTLDTMKHLIMPTITLMFANMAKYIRYIRSSAIEELGKEYVLTAKAKGTPGIRILFKHVLKNSLLPVITLVGMSLPALVTGSFIIESVFGWPGIGTLAMSAINARDYPIIMAYILLSGFLLVLGNFIADMLYAVADPRIRARGE